MARNRYKARYTKPSKRIPLTSLIAYLLVAVTLTLGATFSRFSTSGQSNDTARVASFSIEENLSNQIQTIGAPMAPGDRPLEYPITITNNSEVAVSYTLEANRGTENLPLKLSWKDGKSTGSFAPGAAGSDTVTLIVTWEETKTDYRYSHEIDLITVKLTAEQID